MSLLTTARNEMCYCPGCSHGLILERLGAALERHNIPPEKVCLVTDIGCIGMSDRYFSCHTFHGLHGRSITYAEGIRRARPELTVIVLIGDGGCGIGTAHLVHAARRNADITVVVANNFNFGMTGGQQSPTTPVEAHTTTTPPDRAEAPFDICRTAGVSGAAYVARCSALADETTEYLADAIGAAGFSLVDVWELCTAYFVAANKLNPKKLVSLSDELQMPFGVLERRETARCAPPRDRQPARQKRAPADISVDLTWPARREICLAGSAGQRIRSAAGVLGELAVTAGLFAAQQDDFPITVRKGHSVSYLVVSPEAIEYTGVDRPDLIVILSQEGASRLPWQEMVRPDCTIVAEANVALPPGVEAVVRFSLRDLERQAGKNGAALSALAMGLLEAGWVSSDSLLAAADSGLVGRYREDNLAALRVAVERAGRSAVATVNTAERKGSKHVS